MKQVGIITLHCANNYGAVVQLCGLFYALENAGYKPIIINYQFMGIILPDLIRILPVTLSPRVIISGFLTINRRIARLKKFNKFRNEKLRLSSKYYTNKQLKRNDHNCDVYICGSDQIWNPFITFGVRPAYYLDFVSSGKKCFSYAASFGISKIPNIFKNSIKKFLKKIEPISVREEFAISLIKEITSKNSISLIDPAFLIKRREWENLAIETQRTDYILVYMMQKNYLIYNIATELKNRTGLEIVDLSRYGNKHKGVDEIVVDAGPQEFIGYIKNAKYVCTNSFHGMVLAIIFEKPFIVAETINFSGRISNLLSLLNLKKQVVEEHDFIQNDLSMQFYWNVDETNKIIEREREKAINYLKKNIE